MGLAVCAILHANNTRDMAADARAGAMTLARALGFARSSRLYLAMLVGAHAAAAYLLVADSASRCGVRVEEMAAALAGLLAGGGPPSPPVAVALSQALASLALVAAGSLPGATALLRRFARRDLALLPQATAEWVGVLGASLLLALHAETDRARALAVLTVGIVAHAHQRQDGTRISVEMLVAVLLLAQH